MRPRVALGALALLLVTVACSGTDHPAATPAGPTTTGERPVPGSRSPIPVPVVVQAGQDAWVNVAVANLWEEPDQARPLDAPSLDQEVDVDAWLAAMTVDDRRWLVDRLVTQGLYGDQVTVLEIFGAWAKVVVLRQPTSLDPRGYPGWLPTVQLTSVGPLRPREALHGDAVVSRPTAPLRDGSHPSLAKMELSFDTRLPILSVDAIGVSVGIPGGAEALLSTGDFEILGPDGPPNPTGEDVVRSAQLFTGIDYLWAGTSGKGWDCSGLTHAVYAAHGVVIPRDADDQARAGTPVDSTDLRPGDLLFFGEETVTHVGMYVGDGRMIQAPATGRTVETVAIDQPGLVARLKGARRYLPSG